MDGKTERRAEWMERQRKEQNGWTDREKSRMLCLSVELIPRWTGYMEEEVEWGELCCNHRETD